MNEIKSVLVTEQEIKSKVKELGRQISRDYSGKDLLLVGILKGAAVFLADIMRAVTIPVSIDFMAVSSYGAGVQTSGEVRVVKDLDYPIRDKHILIIEDILDSGYTLRYIMSLMSTANPASAAVCALLDKPSRRAAPIECKYPAITIPDEFVVGYGMDYAEHFRNLPYVGILEPWVYSR